MMRGFLKLPSEYCLRLYGFFVFYDTFTWIELMNGSGDILSGRSL